MDAATAKFLDENKSPSRKVKELDNRGSHFYLAMYWAQELAAQDQDTELKAKFENIAGELTAKETEIVAALNEVQGVSMDVGGYYQPEDDKAFAAMRPSSVFNDILASL